MTNDFDIPIFKKSYELYQTFYLYRVTISKQDRYTIWQRGENLILDILEGILLASKLPKEEKAPVLEWTSNKLNLLRIFLRLSKDVKALDQKKYLILEGLVDEIGRMLGGWLKATYAPR
ncbi:MAG TPA: four helix bundle protein [Candidatus Paceibacterota bacterium]